jgi:hypothetical protein
MPVKPKMAATSARTKKVMAQLSMATSEGKSVTVGQAASVAVQAR